MQAHKISSVVVDIAAFKVCHSVETDIDATALRAARAQGQATSIWMKCHRRFKMQALTSCDAKFMSTRTAAGQFKVVQWGDG